MASSSRFERAGRRRGYPKEAVVTGQLLRLTIAGKVSQVESRCGNLSHDGRSQSDAARSKIPRILGVILSALGRRSRATWDPGES